MCVCETKKGKYVFLTTINPVSVAILLCLRIFFNRQNASAPRWEANSRNMRHRKSSQLICFLITIIRIFFCSNVQNSSSFQHMARMMDSLILNDFPPYTFTKITTTHRPMRANGAAATKLLAKSTANISNAANGVNPAAQNGNNVNGLRQMPPKKVPTQGMNGFGEN